MTSMFARVQTQWARALLHALYEAGVTRVVLSPGSRSTPLATALEHLGGFEVTRVIDERSAGFFALGQAKQSGVPSLLLCTSGSAAAHYLPALVEADESCTPLIVLSADRPPELHGNGSLQTVDQTKLYGNQLRAFVDLGLADASVAALAGLCRRAVQAVALSQHPLPGPVQLNFPARKPLEPVEPDTEGSASESSRNFAPRYFPPSASAVSAEAVENVVQLLGQAKRPVLVVGPESPWRALQRDSVRRFLVTTGWPLVVEATSQLRFGLLEPASGESASRVSAGAGEPLLWDAFDLVVRAHEAGAYEKREGVLPDAILQLGEAPTSAAWISATQGVPRAVVARFRWPDPMNSARIVAHGEPESALRALTDRLSAASEDWRARVRRSNELAWSAVAQVCSESAQAATPSASVESADTAEPVSVREPVFAHEGVALRCFGSELSDGDLLALGNSLSIRLVDTFLPASRRSVRCLSQRGASGIDGLISSALGAAGLHGGQAWLVIGDVAFLHDVGALKLAAELKPALGILVLNNRGGRIFEQLPLAQSEGRDQPGALDAWVTPHDLELWRIGAAFGLTSCRVGTEEELTLATQRTREARVPALIEIMVQPSGARECHDVLTKDVARRLREELGD